MTESTQPDRTRLHITPFNTELYDRIIPPSLQPLASNASFHTIQTFPDKGYGFVELPAMEAQKLRKKLNGSTLKGTKMSVEEARPPKKRKSDAGEEESERKRAKREKKDSRKEKREDGVLAGHEMEEGRRVKRGWSGEDAKGKKDGSKKRDSKDKSSDGAEGRNLRFKTKIPPNRAPVEQEREKKKKDKKAKKDQPKGQVIVEEFTKRRKSRQDIPSSTGHAPGSLSYQEGKGWVDEDGTVVEPERKSKRKKKQRSPSVEKSPSAAQDVTVLGAMDDRIDSASGQAEQSTDNSTSISDAADSSSENEADGPTNAETQPAMAKEVHPLEALFKRPAPPTADTPSNTTPTKPRPAPIDTSFSFFGAGGDVDEDAGMQDPDDQSNAMPPVTPHTKQDLEWRSLRSAAPTPDTAAIGRKFSFPFAKGALDEDEEDDGDEEMEKGEEMAGEVGGKGERGEESAFRRWFFENRGDLNRGWKKRRREERKVVRQRENRRLGRKVA